MPLSVKSLEDRGGGPPEPSVSLCSPLIRANYVQVAAYVFRTNEKSDENDELIVWTHVLPAADFE